MPAGTYKAASRAGYLELLTHTAAQGRRQTWRMRHTIHLHCQHRIGVAKFCLRVSMCLHAPCNLQPAPERLCGRLIRHIRH